MSWRPATALLQQPAATKTPQLLWHGPAIRNTVAKRRARCSCFCRTGLRRSPLQRSIRGRRCSSQAVASGAWCAKLARTCRSRWGGILDRGSPCQNGVTERRGALGGLLQKLRAVPAIDLQTMTSRSGYSPRERELWKCNGTQVFEAGPGGSPKTVAGGKATSTATTTFLVTYRQKNINLMHNQRYQFKRNCQRQQHRQLLLRGHRRNAARKSKPQAEDSARSSSSTAGTGHRICLDLRGEMW